MSVLSGAAVYTFIFQTCKELGLNTRGVPRGLCLLFYGTSGTGKTMTANAVASHLGKKVLLVTVSALVERDFTKVCRAVHIFVCEWW